MNHDATHCIDWNEECPKKCYRAMLTEEIKRIYYPLPISWASFKGTDECMIGGKIERLRLIDANRLIMHLSDYALQEAPWCGANGYGNKNAYEAIEECIKAVEKAPTVEARRAGKWIRVTNGRGGYECDQCHSYSAAYQTGNDYLSRFCPNCGASMVRGEEDE